MSVLVLASLATSVDVDASPASPEVSPEVSPAIAPTWDTAALQRDFTVLGFAAPFVVVVRKSDGVKGSLAFTPSPRLYYGFRADT